ncbi:MAG: hypothetical protein L6Q95_03925, partial [Planctomycetes bacterium]|nr:hypothetical protein [Planctomycetota bacterium]
MRAIWAALLLAAAAFGDAIPEAHAAARRALVERLDALVAWCARSELFLDRDRTCELILRFDPDHREARKWLKYVERDGKWVRLAAYAPPRNRNAKAEPEFAEHRRAAVRRFADDVIAALEKSGAAWSPAARKLAIEDVLVLDPDDERARALNGEVRADGRWIAADVVAA